MNFCPWCGESLAHRESVFCEHCGKRIRPQEEPPVPEENSAGKEPVSRDTPQAAGEETGLRTVRHLEFEEEPEEYTPPEEGWRPSEEEEGAPVIDVRYRDAAGGEKPRRVKRASGRSFILPMVCILAALGLAVGGVCLWTGSHMAPKKFAARFVQAVESGDIAYIREHLSYQNTYEITDRGLELMCRSVREENLLQALEGHLLAEGSPAAEGYLPRLDSFLMVESRPGLFREFEISIRPLLVQVSVGLPEVTLTVDGQAGEYSANGDGDVPLRLLPGSHTVEASWSGYGPSYPLGSGSFTSFSPGENVTLWLGQDTAGVTVELAGNETGLSVLLDGSPSEIEPLSGFVSVSPAFEGMTVTLSCDQYTESFSVGPGSDQRFEVGWIHETEKANPGPGSLAPGDITNRQLAAAGSQLFYRFYLSYLDAINRWDKSLITGVSGEYTAELIQKMEDHNKDYLFHFKWMEIDRDTVDRYVENGKTYAEFGAEICYEYSYKEDQSMWYAGGNFQWVTLVYNESSRQWEIAGTQLYDSINLGAHRIRYEAPAE